MAYDLSGCIFSILGSWYIILDYMYFLILGTLFLGQLSEPEQKLNI